MFVREAEENEGQGLKDIFLGDWPEIHNQRNLRQIPILGKNIHPWLSGVSNIFLRIFVIFSILNCDYLSGNCCRSTS